MDDLIIKLNNDFNFHLSLKTIQVTDSEVLEELQKELNKIGKSSLIIKDVDIYDQLKQAYDDKVDYVLINEDVKILVPLFVVITIDCEDIIKPTIPVLYCLKDNKIIQKIKTQCNKKMTTYLAFKTMPEVVKYVINKIKEE